MSGLASYAIAAPSLLSRLPDDDAIERIDPTATDSAPFIEAVRRFAEGAYADYDMPIPRWAFYDCAVMPGLVFGFAGERPARTPLSILVALPTLEPDHWFVYELAGARRRETLAAAIELLGATAITATAPWGSVDFGIHASRGPLELLAAYVPAHRRIATAVFRYRPGASRSIEPTGAIDPTDPAALAELHAAIEGGARVAITGGPDGGAVPIAVLP